MNRPVSTNSVRCVAAVLPLCLVGCSAIVDPLRLPAGDAAAAADMGSNAEAGQVGDASLPDAPVSCELTASGPVVVQQDGQVVERLRITSTAGDAITIEGKHNVVIRDCEIHHRGGHGIRFSGADGLRMERVAVVHDGAPAAGANDSSERDNINGSDTSGLVIDQVRLIRGADGVHLEQCPAARLSFIEGHDFRGPEPHGQLVRLEHCDGAVLQDFSCVNPQATSWPASVVSIYRTSDATVRRGLVDGCNAPSGAGVKFQQDQGLASGGLCEDVDAVRMGNGCFSAYPGRDIVFRRTRCRDIICTDQGRGAPESGGLAWSGQPSQSSGLSIRDSAYFNLCHDTVWDKSVFDTIELEELDFTARAPLSLTFCWGDAAQP